MLYWYSPVFKIAFQVKKEKTIKSNVEFWNGINEGVIRRSSLYICKYRGELKNV